MTTFAATFTVFFTAAVACAATVAIYLWLTRAGEGTHRASRPGPRSRAGKTARVWRRVTSLARRLPGAVTWAWATPLKTPRASRTARYRTLGSAPGWLGAIRQAAPRRWPGEIHHEPGLSAEDAGTLTWLRQMRDLRHPGAATTAVRFRIAVLAAIISVSGRGTGPAGNHEPGAASLEPGPESEGFGLTVPVPATTLPNRGDAQGRDVRARATTTRRAARAHVTGSLSPRSPRKGGRPACAPPPGPTTAAPPGYQVQAAPTRAGHPRARGSRLIPATDRLAAELAATSPWRTEMPFARWESDTFVGGMLAIGDGAR